VEKIKEKRRAVGEIDPATKFPIQQQKQNFRCSPSMTSLVCGHLDSYL
jgi:hypothetical protein